MPWTAEELEKMRRADEEIERDFALTQEDLVRSRTMDREAVLQRMDNRAASIAAQKRAWYDANRDKVAAQHRAWYEANRDKVAAKQRAYREANRGKRAQKNPPVDSTDKGEG